MPRSTQTFGAELDALEVVVLEYDELCAVDLLLNSQAFDRSVYDKKVATLIIAARAVRFVKPGIVSCMYCQSVHNQCVSA